MTAFISILEAGTYDESWIRERVALTSGCGNTKWLLTLADSWSLLPARMAKLELPPLEPVMGGAGGGGGGHGVGGAPLEEIWRAS